MHQGISKLARGLCFCFRDRLGEREIDVSAQFIHSLVVQPARRANAARAAEGSGSVRSESEIDAEVWRLVRWFYQHYRGMLILNLEEGEEEAKERADTQLRLIAQVGAYQEAITRTLSDWSGRPDPVTQDWINQNWATMLMLKHPEGRSVLSFSGSGQLFYSIPVSDYGDVLSIGRDSGHDLIPWVYVNADGEERITKAENVYKDYSKVAENLTLSRLVPNSRVRVERTRDGMALNFVRSIPGIRNDIVPKYDPQVDEWLHLLGGDDVDELLNWLAAFPLIERPSVALYLQGAPSIGKGMFGQALKNLTIRRCAAQFDQVVQDFQDTMANTPFVWADEKVTTKRMSKSLMDSFKKLISGEADTINRKHEKQVTIEGHWRVLITANHPNALPWDEEVSGADLDAIRMRLMHIKSSSNSALKFLESLGQRDGTEGWPEYAIPQHIMHLAATREVLKGGRFLVEVKPKQYHEDMQSRTTGSDEVLRMLGRFLQDRERHPECVIIKDGQVYLNVTKTYDEMSKIVAQERRQGFPKSERFMAKAIRSISLDEESQAHRIVTARSRITKVIRLWRLNIPYIIDWLDRNEQDADLRQSLGLVIWDRDAPQRIKTVYAQLDATAQAAPPPAPVLATANKPPIPPPFAGNRVVPFPNIGRQSFK